MAEVLNQQEIDNLLLGSLARTAGCPIDKFSGIYLHIKKGTKVKKREKLITIYAESKPRLKEAMKFYKKNKSLIFCSS